jgi:tetratricopeptide (TPR) repeat protein
MASPPSNTSSAALQQAQQHYSSGDLAGARQILQRALMRDAGNADLNYLMGGVLCDLGEYSTAVFFIERAAAVAKDHPIVQALLGEARMFAGDAKGARAALGRAVTIDPAAHAARLNLSLIEQHEGNATAAEAQLREILRHDDTHDGAAANLAGILLDSGRANEAWDLLVTLESRKGPTQHTARMLATIANYLPSLTAQHVASRHRRFGELLEAAIAPMPVVGPSTIAAGKRPLRVGIMSPDFRQHSVSFFTEPLLRHRDKAAIQLIAYSSTQEKDATTARLKPLFDQWHDVGTLGDAMLARRIRDDKVDVLLDLAGLTHGGRPSVLAVRPAPLSITYCGYPNTNGLARVDYRIVDAITDPPGTDDLCTERLIRLPHCFLCYSGDDSAPRFAQVASATAGHITFGSFNVLSKVNDTTLDLWARVLAAVPHSRLLIKARSLDDSGTRERVRAALAARGIAERTELLAHTKTLSEHLATYNRIDVALDTWPYNGTTTTCESLWMGLPVVTLTGTTHASRVGASLLTALGLTELITSDADAFVRTASALALDTSNRSTLLITLRDRMKASPLCDFPGFAARFWGAITHAYDTRSAEFTP